jgi:uncharacterized protein
VLKVASRCNLVCDYCYVYTMADRSWRDRPPIMEPATVVRTSERIAEHARGHGLDEVRVVLHGGEPLLAGTQRLDFVAQTLRDHLPRHVKLDLSVQTNGVLLSEDYLRVMRIHRIRVGISLDGGPSEHDRHRRGFGDRGSYSDTAKALRLLCHPENRDLFAGLLCVVDVRNDPLTVYEALLEFAPPVVDFLLPHGNWSAPPAGLDPSTDFCPHTATPYADWLVVVFDRWYRAAERETSVRLFEEIVNLLLGGGSRSEQIGLSPATFLVVDTDGSIQQSDTLKSTTARGPEMDLNVFADSIDTTLSHPAVVARQIGRQALADKCRRCDVMKVCGGGHYAHRYRRGEGFRHPSVYCTDLEKLIRHIHRRVGVDLNRRAR